MIAFAAAALTAYARWPIDGVLADIIHGGSIDTLWADDYSDDAFRAVRIGMTRSDVYALLGLPLNTRIDVRGNTVEQWSASRDTWYYHRRGVIFKGNRVVEIVGTIDSEL